MTKHYIESDIRNNYRALTKCLIEKHLSITTMESATSGQIASLITDTEGASAILKGAFITYSNEAKIMQVFRLKLLTLTPSIQKKPPKQWHVPVQKLILPILESV